ncbi:MAG: hypothetical protein HQM08_21600 [Candidatus Riflebacteria bacterium]|nr:hypothetical protein [Candidatus Riflebacteria bacterium]
MGKVKLFVFSAIIFSVVSFFNALEAQEDSEFTKLSEFLKSKYQITLETKDLVMIKAVYAFWESFGKSIWPGVDISTTPMSIVFPQKQNILIGHPNPPKDAIYLSESLPFLNKKAFLYPDRTFMNGLMTSPNYEGKPTVFFNTIQTYNEFVHKYAQDNHKPDLENYQKPLLEHLGGILHELFVNFRT